LFLKEEKKNYITVMKYSFKHTFETYFGILSFFCLLVQGCIDPVTPEFEFKEGLVFVEGFASTSEGASFVVVSKSVDEFGVNQTKFEKGALVSFINSDTGASIQLVEQGEAYVPPPDFKAAVGESWELAITFLDGTQYKSSSERVLEPVAISNISATYDTQLRFNEGSNDFEPGHAIAITFDDPADQENYYYWTFRTFENVIVCEICFDGILRNGECTPTTVPQPDYFTYNCPTECWQIRFPETINIFDDQFSNGKTTTNLTVAEVPLYTKREILVELQQFSLTPSAYEYYKVLKDIVDNSAGFNAPPPAALIGNMTNVNDPNDFVFGRFTAASTATASIFINRNGIAEGPIEATIVEITEPPLNSPYPPPITLFAPCTETRFRTAIQPVGWQ